MKDGYSRGKEVLLPNGKPVLGGRLGPIIESLTECIVPDGGKLDVSVSNTDAYVFLANYLKDQDKGARLGLTAMLVAFDLLPFLFIGRFRRFINLTPQERELYLQDWYSSRIYYRRMLVVLLKTIIGMGYYNDPQVLSALGFELPCEEKGGAA